MGMTTTTRSASRSAAAPTSTPPGRWARWWSLGESSIGGGMRRIEAVTGRAAEELFVQQSATLEAISRKLQAPMNELEARLDAYMADTDALRRRLAETERVGMRAEAETLLGRVRDVDGVKLVASVTSASNVESMREMGDYLKQKLDSVVMALGAVIDGSPMIVTMVTPDLVTAASTPATSPATPPSSWAAAAADAPNPPRPAAASPTASARPWTP